MRTLEQRCDALSEVAYRHPGHVSVSDFGDDPENPWEAYVATEYETTFDTKGATEEAVQRVVLVRLREDVQKRIAELQAVLAADMAEE